MSYEKIIRSGNILEHWKYERAPSWLHGIRIKREKRESAGRKGYKKHATRRADNIRRAVSAFRRLVRSNLVRTENPTLLTLTITQVLPLKASSDLLTGFFVRCRSRFGKSFRYIAVPEFQKRGAVHFHCLVWGFPNDLSCTGYWVAKGYRRTFVHTCSEEKSCERRTRLLSSLWCRGFTDAIVTDGSPRLAGYLSKYMSKAMSDIRLGGEKSYQASRNILRPMSLAVTSFDDQVREELGLNIPPKYLHKFSTDWMGECTYQAIEISTDAV